MTRRARRAVLGRARTPRPSGCRRSRRPPATGADSWRRGRRCPRRFSSSAVQSSACATGASIGSSSSRSSGPAVRRRRRFRMMIASLPYRAARHLFSRWCARSPSSGSHPDPHSTWRTTAGAAHQPGAGPSPGRGRPGPHPPGDDPHPDRGRLQPDLRRRPERPPPIPGHPHRPRPVPAHRPVRRRHLGACTAVKAAARNRTGTVRPVGSCPTGGRRRRRRRRRPTGGRCSCSRRLTA